MDVASSRESCQYSTNTVSFTPTNRFSAPPQLMTPFKTPRRRCAGDDDIYDLVEEPSDGTSDSMGGMADNTSADIGYDPARARSNLVDMKSKADAFQGPPAKRKRSAPATQAQSDHGAKNILQQPHNHEGGNGLRGSRSYPSKSSPTLATPPISGRRATSKLSSVISAHELKQPIIFPKLAITKPMAPQGKGRSDAAPSNIINRHLGWTTTEHTVKSQFNGLTKTTLDKLAAFRYTACPSVAEAADQSIHLTQCQDEEVVSNIQQQHDQADVLSGDETLKYVNESDFISQQNYPQTESSLARSDLLYRAVQGTAEDASLRSDSLSCPNQTYNTVNANPSRPVQTSFALSDHHPPSGHNQRYRHHAHGVCLQDNDMDGFMGDEDLLGTSDYSGGLIDLHWIPSPAADFIGSIQEVEDHVQSAPAGNTRTIDAQNHCDDDLVDLPAHSRRAVSNQRENKQSWADTRIQTLRSDIFDYDADFDGVNGVLIASDEFNEGLDDKDLLNFMPVILPESPSKSQPVLQQTLNGSQSSRKPSDTAMFPAMKRYETEFSEILPDENGDADITVPITIPRTSSTTLSDDEFPIDYDDETEMLNLPEIFTNESAVVPPILSYPFDDESDSEIYDSSLKYSPVKTGESLSTPYKAASGRSADNFSSSKSSAVRGEAEQLSMDDEEDWSFIREDFGDLQIIGSPKELQSKLPRVSRSTTDYRLSPQMLQPMQVVRVTSRSKSSANPISLRLAYSPINENKNYLPMQPFARPAFPPFAVDRSPVIGLSTSSFLRTCFRIGELFKAGTKCEAQRQDAFLELFARVTFSFRDPGSTTQHFQFADLWHDRPPFPNGVLTNYKMTGMVESESKVFLESGGEGKMTRVLGRLKRCAKSGTMGWMVHIVNIRETNWEEIRWTKKVVSRELCKSR